MAGVAGALPRTCNCFLKLDHEEACIYTHLSWHSMMCLSHYCPPSKFLFCLLWCWMYVCLTLWVTLPHFLTLFIIMVVFSVCCGCGYLLCTIPSCSKCITYLAAIIKLVIAGAPLPQVRDDDQRGDHDSAWSKGKMLLAWTSLAFENPFGFAPSSQLLFVPICFT